MPDKTINLQASRYSAGLVLLYSTVFVATTIIWAIYEYSWLANRLVVTPQGTLVTDSLRLTIQLVGFVFIIVVFLVQNTTQAFSSNLSREVLRDPHLVLVLLGFIGISAFNISGLYYDFSENLTFVSYVLSLLSLSLLVSLTLIVSHYLDPSNILDRHNRKVIDSIDADRIFSTLEIEDDEETERLLHEAEFYTNTAIEAIKSREYRTVGTCIQNLENLGTAYLSEVDSPVKKNFIQDLNDQYYFLINELGGDYAHQKNLETLTSSIGVLARQTYTNTQNDQQTYLWLDSLKEIFELTAEDLDRTEAYGLSITEINRTVVLHLSNTNRNNLADYSFLVKPINEIASFPLDNGGHGIVVQKCLAAYKWQLITMLNHSVTERYVHLERDIEGVFNQMLALLSASNDSANVMNSLAVAAYFRLDSLYSHIRYYGLYGVPPKIAAAESGITQKPPSEANIAGCSTNGIQDSQYLSATVEILALIIQFQTEATKAFSDSNITDCFSAFPELSFIMHEDLSRVVGKSTQIPNLQVAVTKGFCEALRDWINENDGQHPSLVLDDFVADMLILIYHYNKDDDDLLKMHLYYFLSTYRELVSQHGQDEMRWLYQYLKWFGAIIHNSPWHNTTREIMNNVLIDDFYEPQFHSGSLRINELEEMGYPVDGRRLPSLSAKQIWRMNRSTINQSIPYHIREKCNRYHEYLNREKKWV